jgi:hypothetical protein
MRRCASFLRPLVLGLAACALWGGDAASLAEQINQAAVSFEDQQNRSFSGVAQSLDRWRESKYSAAVKELGDLFAKAAPADQTFLAYHLLSLYPRHKAARAAFTGLGLVAPFDEKGNRIAGVKLPTCGNRELVAKVASLKYPPFSQVAEVVSAKSPMLQSYWKRQLSDLKELNKKLVGFAAQGQAGLVYPMLAYYWPGTKEVIAYYSAEGKPVPRQRTWFPPVDRYLLDHELAGVDCLDTKMFKPSAGGGPQLNGKGGTFTGQSAWDFMENLRNCRIEGVFTLSGQATFTVLDGAGRGAALTIKGQQGRIEHVGGELLKEFAIVQDLATVPSPVQFEVRGRSVSVLVDGVLVEYAQLPADYAYKRMSVSADNLVASQLRARFLSDKIERPEDLLVAANDIKPEPNAKKPEPATKPETPAKPVEEPWLAERRKQLGKPVSISFADTSVEEVVSLLSRIAGVPIVLDEKGALLKDLPVTLAGNDLKLQSVLEWLGRVTDLSYQPTAEGITLTWNK